MAVALAPQIVVDLCKMWLYSSNINSFINIATLDTYSTICKYFCNFKGALFWAIHFPLYSIILDVNILSYSIVIIYPIFILSEIGFIH